MESKAVRERATTHTHQSLQSLAVGLDTLQTATDVRNELLRCILD